MGDLFSTIENKIVKMMFVFQSGIEKVESEKVLGKFVNLGSRSFGPSGLSRHSPCVECVLPLVMFGTAELPHCALSRTA